MKGFTGRGWRFWRKNDVSVQEKHDRSKNDSKISKFKEQVNKASFFKYRKVIMAGAAVVLIAGTVYLGGQQYVKANTISYYRVYLGDQDLGAIMNEAQLQAVIERKEQEYKEKYPGVNMVVNTEAITTKPEEAFKAEVDAEATLDTLYSKLTGYAKGMELKVNGEVIAIVKDPAAVQEVLKQVKSTYIPYLQDSSNTLAAKVQRTGGRAAASTNVKSTGAELESAEIAEEVKQSAVKVSPDRVISAEEAAQLILEGGEKAVQYEVHEGDTISSIAARFGVSQSDLFAANPGVQERTLQIGTVLNVKAIQPALTVRSVERITEEIVTEPQVVVQTNPEMRAGETKVISLGASGLKLMEYRVTKENGLLMSEEWLGQEVIKPSSPKIVMKGTKVVLGEGSGQFAWPVLSAKMTSSYGQRWGRTHKGIDLVSSNKSILAADAGVVSYVGTKSGYGNVIIIDHKNGYETLYGHLKEYIVEKGQVVEKGEKIGVMGNTGRSTGTHLHFEIHEDGSVQNPLKYL